jgi:hypothetical protein
MRSENKEIRSISTHTRTDDMDDSVRQQVWHARVPVRFQMEAASPLAAWQELYVRFVL